MKKIEAVIPEDKLNAVFNALTKLDIRWLHIFHSERKRKGT